MEFFTNTNPFCDIQVRYDPEYYAKYNPNSVENQLGWDLSESFQKYLAFVRERREQQHGQETEDALMAVIDSMNASDGESGASRDQAVTNALQRASRVISRESGGRTDPTTCMEVLAILSCLGDRARIEMSDEIQEEHEEQMEQLKTEETLKGGERDECDRPVHDAADAANGGGDDKLAENA